jgi:hypothetical protein
MHRPPFITRKIPGTYFCQRLSRLQGDRAAGRIRSIEKSSDFIELRTCDLPAGRIRSIEKSSGFIELRTCDLPASRIMPQTTTLLCDP